MPQGNRKNTYKAVLKGAGVVVIGAALLGPILLLSPLSMGAFWPFSSARAADETEPILHDPSLELLEAALNSDPNPSKGDTALAISDGSALVPNSGLSAGTDDTDSSTETSSSASSSNHSGEISVYTVKNGDSISEIADRFGVSVNTILWANDLTIHSTIKPGMDLVILPVSGVRHTVGKGETLSSIATKYDASAAEIATFNGLDKNATVTIGSTLVIPGGAESPAASAKSSTSKSSSGKTSSPAKTTKSSSVKIGSDLGVAVSTGGYFTNPVPGAILYQGIHGNDAVDLSAPSGTPIHAAAAGTVIISKSDGAWNGGYGSYVVISHGNGTQTLYAHMSKDVVTVGETVAQGELIGYVGETGEATGNHLHYEVRGAKNTLGYTCTLMKRCY